MNYIIDGHNLIAKIPGLDLHMLDDEQQLIELLNRYEPQRGDKMEVYFDGAPPGQAGKRNYGRVRAVFVSERQTADDAIRRRLMKLGRSAAQWVVVSSDRSVEAAAREAHAQVMSAEDFAHRLKASMRGDNADAEHIDERVVSKDEVNEWLRIFSQRGKQK